MPPCERTQEGGAVDGSEIRLANQLRLVVYPIIYDSVFHIQGGWECDF